MCAQRNGPELCAVNLLSSFSPVQRTVSMCVSESESESECKWMLSMKSSWSRWNENWIDQYWIGRLLIYWPSVDLVTFEVCGAVLCLVSLPLSSSSMMVVMAVPMVVMVVLVVLFIVVVTVTVAVTISVLFADFRVTFSLVCSLSTCKSIANHWNIEHCYAFHFISLLRFFPPSFRVLSILCVWVVFHRKIYYRSLAHH